MNEQMNDTFEGQWKLKLVECDRSMYDNVTVNESSIDVTMKGINPNICFSHYAITLEELRKK